MSKEKICFEERRGGGVILDFIRVLCTCWKIPNFLLLFLVKINKIYFLFQFLTSFFVKKSIKIYFQTSYLLLLGRYMRPGALAAPRGVGRTRGPKKHKRPAPTPQPGAQSSFAPPQRPSRGAKWLRPAPTPRLGRKLASHRPGAPRPGAHHNTAKNH